MYFYLEFSKAVGHDHYSSTCMSLRMEFNESNAMKFILSDKKYTKTINIKTEQNILIFLSTFDQISLFTENSIDIKSLLETMSTV